MASCLGKKAISGTGRLITKRCGKCLLSKVSCDEEARLFWGPPARLVNRRAGGTSRAFGRSPQLCRPGSRLCILRFVPQSGCRFCTQLLFAPNLAISHGVALSTPPDWFSEGSSKEGYISR